VNARLILLGAMPAALMALAVDFGLGWIEKRLIRG
jgi:ABC-type proline/glycine betaine transport system permease subunit